MYLQCYPLVQTSLQIFQALQTENGFIVDPYDADEFAKKIELILKDENLLNLMQNKSKKIVEKFRFTNIAEGYIAAIEDSVKE